MSKSHAGDVVVVTGAAGRLGRIVAATFEEAGAEVFRVDRPSAADSVSDCRGADLTDEGSVSALFAAIVEKGRYPSTIVHTVGMWGGSKMVDTQIADWRRLIDVNLTTTFLVFREALRLHETHSSNSPLRLIAFSSGQGADRGVAEQGGYSAAKAGVWRLVESIAAEYEPESVTAHAIAPSTILYGEDTESHGIPAQDLANLCLLLSGPAGNALSGEVVRAYGPLRKKP